LGIRLDAHFFAEKITKTLALLKSPSKIDTNSTRIRNRCVLANPVKAGDATL
jgi:hypothetical protein